MKICVFSDLHFDHKPLPELTIDPSCDVIILAGDLASMHAAIEKADLIAHLHAKPTIFVPGNHEYYGGNIKNRRKFAREYKSEYLHILDDRSVVINDTHFIGSTLWTDWSGAKDRHDCAYAMRMAEKSIADFDLIRSESGGSLITAQEMRDMHFKSRKYIQRELIDKKADRTCVITHFAPHPTLRNRRFEADGLSHYFAPDCSELISLKPHTWIFGHTHQSMRVRIEDTLFVSNQGGYRNEPETHFEHDFLMEI